MSTENPEHPGKIFLTEFIKPSGLNISEAAEYLGVSRSTLFDLVQGKSALSPNMALRMEQATKSKAKYWVELQANYNLWIAGQFMPEGVKAFPLPKVI